MLTPVKEFSDGSGQILFTFVPSNNKKITLEMLEPCRVCVSITNSL